MEARMAEVVETLFMSTVKSYSDASITSEEVMSSIAEAT